MLDYLSVRPLGVAAPAALELMEQITAGGEPEESQAQEARSAARLAVVDLRFTRRACTHCMTK